MADGCCTSVTHHQSSFVTKSVRAFQNKPNAGLLWSRTMNPSPNVDDTIIGEIEAQVGCNNNCDTTVRRHLAEMLDSITKITSESEYKQVQLTAVIIDKIFDTDNGTKKELATFCVIGREFTFDFFGPL